MLHVKFSPSGFGDGGVGDVMYTSVWVSMVTLAGVDDTGVSCDLGEV